MIIPNIYCVEKKNELINQPSFISYISYIHVCIPKLWWLKITFLAAHGFPGATWELLGWAPVGGRPGSRRRHRPWKAGRLISGDRRWRSGSVYIYIDIDMMIPMNQKSLIGILGTSEWDSWIYSLVSSKLSLEASIEFWPGYAVEKPGLWSRTPWATIQWMRKKKLMGKQTSNILQLEHGIDGFGEYCDKIDD